MWEKHPLHSWQQSADTAELSIQRAAAKNKKQKKVWLKSWAWFNLMSSCKVLHKLDASVITFQSCKILSFIVISCQYCRCHLISIRSNRPNGSSLVHYLITRLFLVWCWWNIQHTGMLMFVSWHLYEPVYQHVCCSAGGWHQDNVCWV